MGLNRGSSSWLVDIFSEECQTVVQGIKLLAGPTLQANLVAQRLS